MQFRYVIGPDGSVDVADRGLAYGDGLFETMAVRRGALLRYELHWNRLTAGCERLQLPVPDPDELQTRIAATIQNVERGSLKLLLTRGSGPRGYAPPRNPEPLIILTSSSSTHAPAPAITVVSLVQRLSQNRSLAGIKHLCRLEQVLGQQELLDLDADEGLMLDTSGNVIGGTSRNLFAVFADTLVTPDLTKSGIHGVMRQYLLNHCAEAGIRCQERAILPTQLSDADELFMTNALVGIQSVSRLDDRSLTHFVMAERLREQLGLSA